MKDKIKSKVKKTVALLAVVLAVAGCATSEPASRATTAKYGDIVVTIEDGATKNTVHISIGDGAIASADSTGSTETLTSSPTTDIKPDVSIPVNKAGASQTLGSTIGDAVAGLVNGMGKDNSTAASTTDGKCADGSCEDK